MTRIYQTGRTRFGDLLDLKTGDTVEVRLVAVIGHAQDFAVYEASATMSPDATVDEIARHGDKIGKERAIAAFPELASKFYYRE